MDACGWSTEDHDDDGDIDNYYYCGASSEAEPSGEHPRSCDATCTPSCANRECGSN